MSLSGLDTAAVDTAEKKVLQERGAWFLLTYTSRDCVEVLAQGAKGLVEMRDAAENYYNGTRTTSSPPSPLYGMIDFRRRKILIKLILEGTSRLVQARVQVHWNSVTSRFPNHDTVFETASTDELNETGFLAHIELHSGRSSAGSVSKKLHLSGISEEIVEEVPASLEQRGEDIQSVAASKPEENKSSDFLAPTDLSSHPKRISSLVETAAATSAALQESLVSSAQPIAITPEESLERPTTADPNNDDGESRYLVNVNSTDSFPPALDASGRRFSTQSARPSTSDNYTTSLYNYDMLYKPKVKLGPRPSTDRRPPSSKGQAVATLPAGLRSSRVGLSSARPKSRDSTTRPKSRDSSVSTYKVPPPPPIPESNPYNFSPRPSSSGNSVKSLPATLPKSPGMSREKQRLMKFREMYREKENQKANGKASVGLSRAEKAKAANEDIFAEEADNEAEESNNLETLDESEQSRLPIPAKSVEMSPRTIPGSILKPPRQNTPSTPSDDFPRTSGESLSALSGVGNASSPISMVESSAHAASTRPTSVSDSSDLEKAPRSEKETTACAPAVNSTEDTIEVTTPRTVVDDKTLHDEDAQSTPTSSTTPTGNGTATAKMDHNNQEMPSEKAEPSSGLLSASDRRQMRRALVSPITVPTDTNDPYLSDAHLSESDADISYDDDFMDEIHDAVVVEAKSMLVSKSPITPFFSRRQTAQVIDSTTPMPTPLPKDYSPLPSPSIMYFDQTPTGSPARGAGCSPLVGISESSVSQVTLKPVPQESAAKPGHIEDDKSSVINNIDESEAEHDGKDEEHEVALRQSSISRSNSSTMLNNADRTPSFTLLTPTYPAVSPVPRSPVGTFLASVTNQKEDAIIVSKKGRLGSGVASKIADLQRSFSRGSSPGDTVPLPLPAARSFSSSRKPMISQRAGSFTDQQPHSSTPPRSSSSQFNSSVPIRDTGSVRGRAMSKGSLMSFDSRETKTSTPTRNHSSGSIGPARLDHRRLSIYDSPPLPQVEFNDRRDTIQVKATIIRTDGPFMKPESQQFIESPLVVTQQRAISPPPVKAVVPSVTALPARTQSPTKDPKDKKHKRQRSSISAALRGFKSPSTVTLSETVSSQGVSERENNNRQSIDLGSSWRTLTRRTSVHLSRSPSAARSPSTDKPSAQFPRSPSVGGSDRKSMVSPAPTMNGERGSLGRSMSISSMDSVTTTDSHQNGTDAKKKGNRASRLMKRMSNGMSSIASVTRLQLGTLNEVENGKRASVLEEKDENQHGTGWRAVEVGDLNVQFPDTLLWKHRHITIDAKGFLVLRPFQQNNSNPAAATIADRKLERKYHISQFYSPFAPDMERMEMPFSVVLDFREDAEGGVGGCLQVAAQSGKGQGEVLNVLTTAHRVWAG